jgi:hypothetical protein
MVLKLTDCFYGSANVKNTVSDWLNRASLICLIVHKSKIIYVRMYEHKRNILYKRHMTYLRVCTRQQTLLISQIHFCKLIFFNTGT